MKYFGIVILMMVFPILMTAQIESPELLHGKVKVQNEAHQSWQQHRKDSTVVGAIRIHASGKILLLDSLTRSNPMQLTGYRVQLFFGKRDIAEDKRADFLRQFPGIPAYISYLAPNFRVRAGNFRSRLAAERFKQTLEKKFPGCYIVKTWIDLPSLKPMERDSVSTTKQ